jgi:hypothetical protein
MTDTFGTGILAGKVAGLQTAADAEMRAAIAGYYTR